MLLHLANRTTSIEHLIAHKRMVAPTSVASRCESIGIQKTRSNEFEQIITYYVCAFKCLDNYQKAISMIE